MCKCIVTQMKGGNFLHLCDMCFKLAFGMDKPKGFVMAMPLVTQ